MRSVTDPSARIPRSRCGPIATGTPPLIVAIVVAAPGLAAVLGGALHVSRHD